MSEKRCQDREKMTEENTNRQREREIQRYIRDSENERYKKDRERDTDKEREIYKKEKI